MHHWQQNPASNSNLVTEMKHTNPKGPKYSNQAEITGIIWLVTTVSLSLIFRNQYLGSAATGMSSCYGAAADSHQHCFNNVELGAAAVMINQKQHWRKTGWSGGWRVTFLLDYPRSPLVSANIHPAEVTLRTSSLAFFCSAMCHAMSVYIYCFGSEGSTWIMTNAWATYTV